MPWSRSQLWKSFLKHGHVMFIYAFISFYIFFGSWFFRNVQPLLWSLFCSKSSVLLNTLRLKLRKKNLIMCFSVWTYVLPNKPRKTQQNFNSCTSKWPSLLYFTAAFSKANISSFCGFRPAAASSAWTRSSWPPARSNTPDWPGRCCRGKLYIIASIWSITYIQLRVNTWSCVFWSIILYNFAI